MDERIDRDAEAVKELHDRIQWALRDYIAASTASREDKERIISDELATALAMNVAIECRRIIGQMPGVKFDREMREKIVHTAMDTVVGHMLNKVWEGVEAPQTEDDNDRA